MSFERKGTSSSYGYYDATDEHQPPQQTRIQLLEKAIREQRILLAATNDDYPNQKYSIDTLKDRIIEVCRQLQEQQTRSTSSTAIAATGGHSYDAKQWWSRYQTNIRQLEDLGQQKRSLVKEMDYLVNVNIKDLKARLEDETNRWAQLETDYNKIRASPSLSTTTNSSTSLDTSPLSESDRLKAKAQAMVAARLQRSRSHSQLHDDLERVDRYQQAIHEQVKRIDSDLSFCQQDMDRILQDTVATLDLDRDTIDHELRQRQIFEKGLFASDELSSFIDSLRSFDNKPMVSPSMVGSSTNSKSYFSSAPTASRRASYRRSLLTPLSPPSLDSDTPPPIPTTQRPDSPRSSADIKAEAHRRIEQRRQLFLARQHNSINSTSKTPSTRSDTLPASSYPTTQSTTNNNGLSAIDEEEKAAQERLRQAEAQARQRLLMMQEKRDQARQEAAAAEEKRRLAAVEAAKKAEAEMAEEKKRRDQEARERLEQEQRLAAQMAERQRKLDEEARLEQERRDAEQQAKEKLEDETRQRRARMAAQQAAKEKRRLREEQESREREAQLARAAEERERRQAWEKMEAENQQRATTGDGMVEPSEAIDRRHEQVAPSVVVQQEDDTVHLTPGAAIQRVSSPLPNHSEATAGTSGYGVDMDDEVDFSSSKCQKMSEDFIVELTFCCYHSPQRSVPRLYTLIKGCGKMTYLLQKTNWSRPILRKTRTVTGGMEQAYLLMQLGSSPGPILKSLKKVTSSTLSPLFFMLLGH